MVDREKLSDLLHCMATEIIKSYAQSLGLCSEIKSKTTDAIMTLIEDATPPPTEGVEAWAVVVRYRNYVTYRALSPFHAKARIAADKIKRDETDVSVKIVRVRVLYPSIIFDEREGASDGD